MKDMLVLAKKNNDKQGIFAYKGDFNEDGANWDENIWSKRLGACVGKYIVSGSYTVEYTGDKGKDIYNNELFYHRFHGAPDLTIRKHDDERGVATITTSLEGPDDDSDENSQGTVVGTLENSVQIEGKFRDNRLNMTILEKSGELIANMHIMLVNKMLKVKRLKSMNVQNLEVVGILISRPSGIVLCRYEMPVLKLEDLHTRRNAKLTLQSKVNSILPENICVSIRDLFDDGE